MFVVVGPNVGALTRHAIKCSCFCSHAQMCTFFSLLPLTEYSVYMDPHSPTHQSPELQPRTFGMVMDAGYTSPRRHNPTTAEQQQQQAGIFYLDQRFSSSGSGSASLESPLTSHSNSDLPDLDGLKISKHGAMDDEEYDSRSALSNPTTQTSRWGGVWDGIRKL